MKNSFHTLGLLLVMLLLLSGVLGMLAMETARSDLRRAQRQAELASARQDCVNQAQSWLAELAATGEEGSFSRQFDDSNGHILYAAAKWDNGQIIITDWRARTEWQEAPLGELPQFFMEVEIP